METDPRRWVQALRASHDALVSTVARLTPDQVDGPSYCRDWSVAQVLSHVGSGAEISLLGLERTLAGEPPLAREEFPRIWDRWNALAGAEQARQAVVWDRRQVSVLQGLDEPVLAGLTMSMFGMELDAVGVVGLRLGEHALHTWDVAVTLDPTSLVLPSSVELLVDRVGFLAGRLGQADAMPDGQAIGIHATDPDRRFLLSKGDGLTWGDWSNESPEGVVELPSEALLRLVYGRLDPDHTPAGIKTDGEASLDVLRRVFPGF